MAFTWEQFHQKCSRYISMLWVWISRIRYHKRHSGAIDAEWGVCVGNLTTISSDNGLAPCRRQAIIWTNVGILSGTNFGETLIEIQTFSAKKIRLKVPSAKCCPFHLGLSVLKESTEDHALIGWDCNPQGTHLVEERWHANAENRRQIWTLITEGLRSIN